MSDWMMRRVSKFTLTVLLALSAPTMAQHAEPATGPASRTAAPPVPADTTSPRGSMKLLFSALSKGDGEAIRKLIVVSNPLEQRMVDALVASTVARTQLRDAAVKSFGAAQADTLISGENEAATAALMTQIDASEEKITGDSAKVNTPGGEPEDAMGFAMVSGGWRVPASEFAKNADPAAIELKIDDMNFSTSLMNDFAKDIAASKYKTADEAAKDIRQRTDVALMKHVAERQAGAATAPGTQPAAVPSTRPQ